MDVKHQILDLFPTPLVRMDINVNGVAEFFDKTIKPNQGQSNNDDWVGDPGLVHYHNNNNVFELYDELKGLGDDILNAANFVYKDVLNYQSSLRFTNAWFNECAVGSYQFMHNHCNSMISGTIYLRTDENTAIQFRSPYGGTEVACTISDIPSSDQNKYNYNYHLNIVNCSVGNGVCLFWPSYLYHGYSPNLTPNRLSLSFNLMPESFNAMYNPYFSS